MFKKASIKLLALALVCCLMFSYSGLIAKEKQTTDAKAKTENVDQKSSKECMDKSDMKDCSKKCSSKSAKASKKGCCPGAKASECKDASTKVKSSDTKAK